MGTGGGNVPMVMEGQPVYCLQGAGATSQNSQGMGYKANTSYTLNTTDAHGVAYIEAVSLLGDKVSGTLMARDYKGIGRHDTLGSAVCIPTPVRYIVRRLTPTECARLQGFFPDTWGHPDVKTELTDEEYQFWLNVRNTHAEINGKAAKDYARDQMLTWYNKLHTDSAEYKLWGNGVALPCCLYVMEGIADEPRN
jgi:DNA (cytosine-5)-methyltransferase 1